MSQCGCTNFHGCLQYIRSSAGQVNLMSFQSIQSNSFSFPQFFQSSFQSFQFLIVLIVLLVLSLFSPSSTSTPYSPCSAQSFYSIQCFYSLQSFLFFQSLQSFQSFFLSPSTPLSPSFRLYSVIVFNVFLQLVVLIKGTIGVRSSYPQICRLACTKALTIKDKSPYLSPELLVTYNLLLIFISRSGRKQIFLFKFMKSALDMKQLAHNPFLCNQSLDKHTE